jgi:hypothetical protein
MRPEIRIAKVVPVAQSPVQAATRYGTIVVEWSEGRARITFDGGADLKLAAKLVAVSLSAERPPAPRTTPAALAAPCSRQPGR